MQSFIGYIPVSTRFAPEIPRSLVPVGVGRALGRASNIGQRFVEVLTAEYRGHSLTTDVECEIVSYTVVIGSNWLAAWACVEHPDLYSSRNTGQSTTSSASECSRFHFVPLFPILFQTHRAYRAVPSSLLWSPHRSRGGHLIHRRVWVITFLHHHQLPPPLLCRSLCILINLN
jgi:hypothetical protein